MRLHEIKIIQHNKYYTTLIPRTIIIVIIIIRACSFLEKTTHKRSHRRLGYGIYPEIKQLNEKPCYCVWLNCMHVVTVQPVLLLMADLRTRMT